MRILIINLLNIGDVLFTTPAMRSVRDAYPDAGIDVLVKRLAVDTVAHNPIFTNIFSMDTKSEGRSTRAFLRLMSQLRGRRYDLLISLHSCARVTLITAFSGAKRKIGLASRGFDWVLHSAAHRKTEMHMVTSYLEVLRDLGIPPLEHTGMEMHVDEASRENASKFWQQEGLERKRGVVGLNPGARAAVRLWPTRNWSKLADRLNQSGACPVIFGGPGDVEMATAIRAGMETKSPILTGRVTLLELAVMLRQCAVLVTGDTGPMHIAASQNTPVAALFGPANPAITGPYGVTSVILKSRKPCSGCDAHSTDPKQHTCMTDITVEEVYESVVLMLEETSQES